MEYFTDIHFHAMTMDEPNFASFISSFFSSSPVDVLQANNTENYILSTKLLKGENLLKTLNNTLTAFERPIDDVFCMMEDDLKGKFNSPSKYEYAPLEPYLNEGILNFRGKQYKKMLMVPLLMDFSENQAELNNIYYTYPAQDKITPYAKATVKAIKSYYKKRPDGIFEFYPFIGINPALHSKEFLISFLNKYINTSHYFHSDHTVPSKMFYGIKIYPPLGFNPWPEEDKDLFEKTNILYSFCEKYDIPIITHCDDQGFRGVAAQTAWQYTDPLTWKNVLLSYPKLRLDFAHFGKQYASISNRNAKSLQMRLKKYPSSPWFRTIIELMCTFDNVYSDLSFTGCYPEFYSSYLNYLDSLTNEEKEKVIGRTLFGSDFSVNLLKVESYTQYYSIFENSNISDKDIHKIASINPIKFLGLKEKQN